MLFGKGKGKGKGKRVGNERHNCGSCGLTWKEDSEPTHIHHGICPRCGVLSTEAAEELSKRREEARSEQ